MENKDKDERCSPDIAKLADELVEAVPSKGGYILVSAESRDEIVAALRARSSAGNVTVPVDAIVNLVNHQHQCDMDGVMVQVSRQALCEVLAYVTEVRLDNKWADGVAQRPSEPLVCLRCGTVDAFGSVRKEPSSLSLTEGA